MRDRRQFLAEMSLLGAASALVPALGCAEKKRAAGQPQQTARAAQPGRARVVLVRSEAVMSKSGQVEPEALSRMLELGLRRLAGTDDARAALAKWVRPADVAGLKVNCLAGRHMSTHRELTEALVALLARVGLPPKNMVVFDRSDSDLRRGGYPIRTSGAGYRCQGNESAGYQRELTVMPHGASRFSTIATDRASVLINLPILKDHGIAGMTGALKNNFGLVHNPNKFHLNGCDPHVAEVNAHEPVRHKQRLIVCDALRVQVEGGPAFHPAGAQVYGGLLLATDPVALDVVALEVLEELRRQRKLPSLKADGRPAVHLAGAAAAGLGVGDRRRITLVEVKPG